MLFRALGRILHSKRLEKTEPYAKTDKFEIPKDLKRKALEYEIPEDQVSCEKNLYLLFSLNFISTKNVLSVLPADSSQVHFPNFFTTIAFPMFLIFKPTRILSMIFHLEIDFLKFSDMGRIKSEIMKLLLVVGRYLFGIIFLIRYFYNLN